MNNLIPNDAIVDSRINESHNDSRRNPGQLSDEGNPQYKRLDAEPNAGLHYQGANTRKDSEEKSTRQRLTPREKILYALASLSLLSANVAVYIGLFMPPKGEVDYSLLGYFGTVCAFAAAVFGISSGLQLNNPMANHRASMR